MNLIKKYETNFKGIGPTTESRSLTGSKFGPGLYDIIVSLGKEEVKKRLEVRYLFKIKADSFDEDVLDLIPFNVSLQVFNCFFIKSGFFKK
jgi:hypothetical protein